MGRERKVRLLLGLGRREVKQAARVGYLGRAGENRVHWAERGVWTGERRKRGKFGWASRAKNRWREVFSL